MNRRENKLRTEIAIFIKQYKRKAYPRFEPNDRAYDRKIERIVKRMKPEQLDELLHGAEDDEPQM